MKLIDVTKEYKTYAGLEVHDLRDVSKYEPHSIFPIRGYMSDTDGYFSYNSWTKEGQSVEDDVSLMDLVEVVEHNVVIQEVRQYEARSIIIDDVNYYRVEKPGGGIAWYEYGSDSPLDEVVVGHLESIYDEYV